VKRAIGIPGDRIRIENKQVYRNGIKLDEPYKVHKASYPDPYRDNFPSQPYHSLSERAQEMLEHNVVNGEVVVPPHSYFAMGDNRDNSLDSRYWGFVPRENIIGKPLIIYWSYETTTDRLADPTIGIDHILDLGQHFFTKTRWSRTLQLLHGYPSKN
jgi:signal peptidase I